MKTGKNRPLRLLVLVPHRDTRRQLRAWSASLFAAGLCGAWSFPWVAPLAMLNQLLSGEELKRLARSLRQDGNLEDGKFIAGEPISVNFEGMPCIAPKPARASDQMRFLESETLSVFGSGLNIELPNGFFDDVRETVVSQISPIVLGSSVLYGGLPDSFPPPPEISFRAAALANMSYCEQDNNFFEWKIGALHWLPKV